jgi:hypothetical protein
MKTFNHIRSMAAGLLIICAPAYLHAQSLVVGRGANLVLNDGAKIVLHDASLINHGSIHAGKSTFIFTGNTPVSIGGLAPASFHHLILRQPAGQLRLDNDIAVSGMLEMQGGNLELNNRRLDLVSSGSIAGENPQARITGANGGVITATAILNAPQNENPGNLGIVITSAASLGTTVITRGHVQQMNQSGERSINRYYDIQHSSNMNADISLRFLYLEPELANNNEASLVFWSKANTNWSTAGKESGDAGNNWITKDNINTTGRFTLGIADKKAVARTFLMNSYPNPATDRFTVALYSETGQRGAVSLVDASGKVLERKPVQYIKGTNTMQWDLSKYAAGTYFLVFENTGQPNLKVIKQR